MPIATEATQKLHNAVRRGDLLPVCGPLTKGANPTASAPDGTSLLSIALENNLEGIASALQGISDDFPDP